MAYSRLVSMTEEINFKVRSLSRVFQGKISVSDTLSHGITIVGARYISDDEFIFEDRLLTHNDYAWVSERYAAQFTSNALRFDLLENSPSPKITFVELDREAQLCFVWVVFAMNIISPQPIAFLQSEGIKSSVAGSDHAQRFTSLPKSVP